MKKLIFLLVILGTLTLSAQTTYLQCGAILDTKTGKLLPERTIVVNGNKISEIRDGYVGDKASMRIIDLRSKTVMPGFIDMHVHIESESNPKAYLQTYTLNEADIAFNSVGFAETTLMAGFTTVRDLGGSGVNIAIRDAIAAGKIKGPRVFTAGKAIGTTGGHADPTNGYREDLLGDPGPKEGVVNSVDDARKAVRQRYKNGADLIKITATGGVLSVAKNGQNPQFTLEEIKAITQTAADYGYHVAAHAHGDEGMQRAVKGGVKTIEHGTLMSEETMQLMKEYDAYLVPTITAGKEVTENARIEGYFPAVIAKKALEIGPMIQDTFKKAYELGVPIAFGTDAGVFPHGANAREFVYMVEAGMPVLKAIQSATLTNARLLGMQDSLGQISKDFLADIIAVDGNPLENVNLLKEVTFVMKDGEVVKQ
ncbi:amidohydrolase family protein [Zeaxanthinibacter enoshimensis]|uniref:metal-dependent hydrolase family protein n=1 Tax=Zeaxanthinibacter enoshimensis TaxID=392009 RepID=UPI00356A98E4